MTPLVAFFLGLLCYADAFTSTSINSRPVIINGKPTTVNTINFVASSSDSHGTFQIGQCTGQITANPPVYNYVMQPAGNVPQSVIPVEANACVVPSVDAYRQTLQAQGQDLDLVYTFDGDSQIIVPASSDLPFFSSSRRLLDFSTPSSTPVTSFGATSKAESDGGRGSLNTPNAFLLQMLKNYQKIDRLIEEQVLVGNNVSRLLIDSQNRTLDLIEKLVVRGQNTDAAVNTLAAFTFLAYDQLSTNISQLFALSGETSNALIALYNGLLADVANQVTLSGYTADAIQGLLDYREADKAELQAWIDNNELKDLLAALWFHDASLLPANSVPYVRHPGIAPMGVLEGPDLRLLLDDIAVNTMTSTGGGRPDVVGDKFVSIAGHRFKVYMSTEFALQYNSDDIDARLFSSLMGPTGCVPPYQDLTYSKIFLGNASKFDDRDGVFSDASVAPYNPYSFWRAFAAMGNGTIADHDGYFYPYPNSDVYRYYTYNQTWSFVPEAPVCDLWVDVTLCECTATPSTVTPPAQYSRTTSFRWSNSTAFLQGDTDLSAVCQSLSPGFNLWCVNTLVTDIETLNDVLLQDVCWASNNVRGYIVGASNPLGLFSHPMDPIYLSSYRTQLRAQTAAPDFPTATLPGIRCTSNRYPLFGNVNSQEKDATDGNHVGFEGLLYHFTALMTAAYPVMQIDLAKLRLKKFGRLPGVETISQPTNLYSVTRYDSEGNVMYDGDSTPLACQKATWNAYSTNTIPVTNLQAQTGSSLVSSSVTVVLTCPPCGNDNECYSIPSQNITHDIELVDVGAFALNANFLVLGDPDSVTMTELYDPPAKDMVISAVIESRSFTPFYVLLPPGVTTTPNFSVFSTYGERNTQYSAQFGTVSPQAYLQTLNLSPQGHPTCSSTGRIAGAQWCSILDAYSYTGDSHLNLAMFSPNAWTMRFSVTLPSGEYFDTVEVGGICPLVTLRPAANGALFLVLQNDASASTRVVVEYAPLDGTCSGVCCNSPGQSLIISPRYVQYYQIPVCPYGDLSINVTLVGNDLSSLGCFADNGSSLAAEIQLANTVLGLDQIVSFNYTEVYTNQKALVLKRMALDALLRYQQAQRDYSSASQQLIANLTRDRDYYQQQLINIQTLTGFTPSFNINVTEYRNEIDTFLTENIVIDAEITADIGILREELGVGKNATDYVESLGQEVIDAINQNDDILVQWADALINEGGKIQATEGSSSCRASFFLNLGDSVVGGAKEVGNVFIPGEFDTSGLAKSISCLSSQGADGQCSEGLWDSIFNSFKGSGPGISEYFACIWDSLITWVIGLVVFFVVMCLLILCGPSCCGCCVHLFGAVGSKWMRSIEEYEKRQKRLGKNKPVIKRKKSYSEVRSSDEELPHANKKKKKKGKSKFPLSSESDVSE